MSLSRVKDWLNLLGFDIIVACGQFDTYNMPACRMNARAASPRLV